MSLGSGGPAKELPVGTITEVGTAVKGLKAGDRVIVSCISSCGSCSYG